MNIGIFTDTYFPQINGTATSSMVLKRELEKQGHNVYLFTTTDPNSEPDSTVIRAFSVPLIFLRTHRFAKSFNNIKNELDLERLRIHSDDTMEGRIFIGFISLILMSYIREKMRKGNLYKTYTFSSLLKELKKQRLMMFGNGQKMLTEITAQQKAIYKAIKISEPNPSSI